MTNPIDLLRAVLEHEKHGLVYFARNGSALALLQQIRSAVEPTARAVVFREDCERCLSERDHGYPSCGYCGKEFVRLQSKSSESL